MSQTLNRRHVLIGGGAAAAACRPAAGWAAGRPAPDFVGIESWLNSAPLSMRGLRGRPVLVTFWARECINCIHAMPAIKSWWARYRDRGFVVVAVHTPEFDVERSRPALQAAAERFGLSYPIAQDNASATWNAWGNQYWPAEYLVDREGRIVYSHFGEGGYERTEGVLRTLLA